MVILMWRQPEELRLKPTVILPDTSPLVHLAAVEALDILTLAISIVTASGGSHCLILPFKFIRTKWGRPERRPKVKIPAPFESTATQQAPRVW